MIVPLIEYCEADADSALLLVTASGRSSPLGKFLTERNRTAPMCSKAVVVPSLVESYAGIWATK